MDSRDGIRALLAGATCPGCGAAVPADAIALLAERANLAYVEVRCPACGSVTMGVVVDGEDADAGPGEPRHPELLPGERARLAGRAPVGRGDVERMRRFLDGWHGDLRSLLGDDAPDDGDR